MPECRDLGFALLDIHVDGVGYISLYRHTSCAVYFDTSTMGPPFQNQNANPGLNLGDLGNAYNAGQ